MLSNSKIRKREKNVKENYSNLIHSKIKVWSKKDFHPILNNCLKIFKNLFHSKKWQKKLILPYAKLSNYSFRLFIATTNFIRTLIETISHIDIRSVVDDQMNEFGSCSLLFDVTVCICICFVDSTYLSKELIVLVNRYHFNCNVIRTRRRNDIEIVVSIH